MPIKRGRGRPSSQPTCDALQNCLLNLPAVWTSGTTVPLTTKLLLYGIEVPCKPCGPKCRGITRNPSCLCALQPPKISLDLDEGGTNGIDTGSEDNKKRRKLNSNFPNRACAKRGQIWRHPSLEQVTQYDDWVLVYWHWKLFCACEERTICSLNVPTAATQHGVCLFLFQA